ncbi:LCP family protein [Hespellia stercorisuis]|uniref:Transcriptional attenuator, LytR family n=1 Tax=Hespellia stercorisuis DSM 15480 TaxID=1121950 RepID=A0A1M6JWX3_9FIRM|nr:LCP family protein [Hespellia stercorisuis]SHJ51202.1 transcriptional attenuator, LytR family [Hespellia stercorisuis DSM 15480]
MGKGSSKRQERENYKKAQEQKKRQLEKRQARNGGNPAKSYTGEPRGRRSGKSSGRSSGGNNEIGKKVGLVLCALQLLASLVFMGSLLVLNMLPNKYLIAVGGVLLVLLILIGISQFLSRKNGIAGKVVSVILIIVLVAGSFYVIRANSAVSKITKSSSDGNYKTDNIVVAVKTEDSAKKIKDAKSYNFGVQYVMKPENTNETVAAINKKLGSEITTTEYQSLPEQANALMNGEVQAIIYNEAYTSLLEDSVEGYSDNVRIIYTNKVKSEVSVEETNATVDDTFTVYISGIDVYGDISTSSRSDVNIIAVVNPTSHQILLVTTPRDYYVQIPGISGGQCDKLTHAGIYGVDASMATLAQLYNTQIDFYSRVNFTSLVQIVDALGGVDVDSPQTFTTSEDSGLVMDVVQGMNHFTGEQALAFSRERQNVEGGDNQRGVDQQLVITAMIKKMLSPAMLTGANGIISSVSGNIDTNMSQEQIQQLIKTQLDTNPTWSIKSVAADGTADEQACFSSGEELLYVTQPNMDTINAIQAEITAVHSGEALTDSATLSGE